ncbi:MAG: sigma-70 family RNA polymerase sigma factor [Deltaproteobacteria bacterium]|nr:sigma-70 family RNA polymerase sigma factor [Deltaproteobacteria bacterium]
MLLGAAEDAYRSFGGTLRGWIRRRVADDATADDLLQTVLLRVHERQGQLDDRERLAPWVFRIARNVVADHHRGARPMLALDDADPTATAIEPDEPDELAGLALWLAWQIDTLPEHYRDALRRTELQGQTMAEAAAALGLSVSGTKSRVQRGRALLAGKLRRCCEVELDHAGRPVDYRALPGGCADC